MKKTLIFPVLVISIFLAAVSIPDAHALTFELNTSDSNGVCENEVGGTWNSNTVTCTATSNTLNFVTLQIDNGVTVVYNGADMINQGNGVVDNLGTITINSGGGFSNIGPVAEVDNTGTINVNSGGFGGGGPIINSGNININSGGQFAAAGLVNNTGIITVSSGGTLANSGTININSGGTLANSGTITTYPGETININSGIFNNKAGGTITNNGNIYSNNLGGSITNAGTINNQAGGLMSNIGPVTNQAGALISNSGTITNNGLFNNLGTIDNNCGGIINHVIAGNPPIDTCNTPPVANADSYSTTVNTALSVPALTGVLANDKDSDGDTITASLVAGTSHGALILNSDGSFTYTPNTGFVGSDSFQYQANDGHGNTATATDVITVNKGGSIITLSSTPNPSDVGQQVTFTAAISPSPATGTVTFNNGTESLGTVTISGGAASLTSSFAAGTYPITAVYSGDTLYSGNRSNTVTETVNKITTVIALSSSQNPSLVGQSITFTATISPSIATGTVTFNDSSTELGSGTVSGGIATFTMSSLPVGPHSITAIYSGDSNFGPSTSPVLVQTVLLSTSGKVTGGGHLGKNTNLGFDVSSKDGKTFKGHLEYNDKTAKIDLDSVSVTQLYIDSSMTSATFAGNATMGNNEHGDDKKHNASVFTFLVNVTDPDKKGERHDTFSITVTNSTGSVIYQNSGIVQGHIEIHNIDTDDGGHDDKNKDRNSH